MHLNYVDPIQFGQLLAAPSANHSAICSTIRQIADGRSLSMQWQSEHEREDAVADATCHAIAQIPKFDGCRRDRGFSFFTRVVERQFWRSWRQNQRARDRHIALTGTM